MHLFIHITNTWRLLYVMVPVLCDRFVATSKADTIPVLLIFYILMVTYLSLVQEAIETSTSSGRW